MNFFNSIKSLNTQFLCKFYNKKLATLGGTIGGISGFIFLNEYYTRSAFNNVIKETNKVIKTLPKHSTTDKLTQKELKSKSKEENEIETFSFYNINISTDGSIAMDELEEYYNPFNIFIIDSIPYSINFLVTVSVGACFGTFYMTYYPITIGGTVLYNLFLSTRPKEKNK